MKHLVAVLVAASLAVFIVPAVAVSEPSPTPAFVYSYAQAEAAHLRVALHEVEARLETVRGEVLSMPHGGEAPSQVPSELAALRMRVRRLERHRH